MKKYKAFTLAETILALLVIGILGMLAMGNIAQVKTTTEAYATVSKAYYTLANITGIIESQKGPLRFWQWSDDFIKDNYLSRLNVTCEGPSCFSDEGSRDFWSTRKKFVTADGIYWSYHYSANCSLNENPHIKSTCAYFEIDVNGPKKPNYVGTDIFGFGVDRQGLYPFGGCSGCSDNCSSGTGSWGCAAKIIRERGQKETK